MLFDLRASQEMAREPTPPDINTSWLGSRAVAIIFAVDFIFHVRFIFRPGCARLSHAAGHVLISSDINGSIHMGEVSGGWLLGLCEKKQSFEKGKGLPCLGCFVSWLTLQQPPGLARAPFWEDIMQPKGEIIVAVAGSPVSLNS